MAEKYGYALGLVTGADYDEGIFVYSFSHDFDGKPGFEMGHHWLPTSQSTNLQFIGDIANTAGTLDVITNDVAPVTAVIG